MTPQQPLASAPVALLSTAAATVASLLDQAGGIALRCFRTEFDIDDKGGAFGYDPVTAADRAIEALLRTGLAARFPEHAIIGEEHGRSGPDDAPATWIIDPIDGTRAFISGLAEWGVLVGLTYGGEPVAGWADIPFLSERFSAIAGTGTYRRGTHRQTLRTRRTTDLATATLFCTHPAVFTRAEERAAFERLAGRVRLQRYGGDCYSYCLLALGQVDLVVEGSLQAYDIVPLIPIIAAAGGVVTDLEGRPPLSGGTVIAAATPELHAQALAVMRESL